MSDVIVVALFAAGYVFSGLLLLGHSLGSDESKLDFKPVRVRSRRE